MNLVTPVQLDYGATERPDAHVDSRSLSQAWYDALYGSRSSGGEPRGTAPQAVRGTVAPDRQRNEATVVKDDNGRAPLPAPTLERTITERRRATFAGGTLEVTARRVSVRRTTADRPASGEPESEDNVIASLSSDGIALSVRCETDGVRVTATCRPDTMATAEHALEQARRALATRGIRFSSELSIRGDR